MLMPLRMGNSNRADYRGIVKSLRDQRGSNLRNAPVGSIVWIEINAWARAIYSIWLVNQKLSNQFNPNTLTDFLSRWETICGIAPLPGDTLTDRRNRIAAKFALVGQVANQTNLTDTLDAYLGSNFVQLLQGGVSRISVGSGTHPAGSAYARWFGGSGSTFTDPISIPAANTSDDNGVNGQSAQFINNSDQGWFSTVNMVFVELQQLANQPGAQFYALASSIFTLLQPYLPAYVTFDWFNNTFSDDGYAGGAGLRATITVAGGSTSLAGSGTAWNTPFSNGVFNVRVGSILEAFDDNGDWQRLQVLHVNSDTSITLNAPAPTNITGKVYVVQGFFLDCDPTAFPYPPIGSLNLDNAGLNSV